MKHCLLEEVNFAKIDFAEADVRGANFVNCDFRGALFDQTNFEKVNLSTSKNYALDLEAYRIRNAKFSKEDTLGLLAKYDIIIE